MPFSSFSTGEKGWKVIYGVALSKDDISSDFDIVRFKTEYLWFVAKLQFRKHIFTIELARSK